MYLVEVEMEVKEVGEKDDEKKDQNRHHHRRHQEKQKVVHWQTFQTHPGVLTLQYFHG
jgi:hypothetical protein